MSTGTTGTTSAARPGKVHDELHATEDGVFHPSFHSGYDTIVDHKHRH
jgi:hypothetical protein